MSDTISALPLPEGIGQRVESLVKNRAQVDAAADVSVVRNYFIEYPAAFEIPVTRSGRPIGWIGLRELMGITGDTHHPVSTIMRPGCTTIQGGRGVTEMESMLRDGSFDLRYGGLVVVDDDGFYLGHLDHRELLQVLVTQDEPLGAHGLQHGVTGLPGHLPLVERTRRLLQQRGLFVVASLDIRGFNAFNDRYGYARGDQVLRFVAGLLQSHIDPALDFAAHTGADNFTVLFSSIDWFERCEAMLQECDARSPRFYDAGDRRKGGLEQIDVAGKRLFTPVFSLSIGITQVEPGKFRDQHSLLRAARDVKSRAGMTYGGAIFIEGMTDFVAGGIAGSVQH